MSEPKRCDSERFNRSIWAAFRDAEPGEDKPFTEQIGRATALLGSLIACMDDAVARHILLSITQMKLPHSVERNLALRAKLALEEDEAAPVLQ